MKNRITANLTRLRILGFCVSLLSIASLSIVVSVEAGYLTQTAGQTPASTQATPPPQTAAGEKTVEQVQKNIQVLSGLPQSQLVPVMNYMGSSLGVKCTFCHVKNGDKWDFVSDAKPEKGSAREMIKMVQGINKGNFKGNPAIGCFTCHRGSEHPVRVPQLPIAAPTPFAESAETATATKETPPTADQILAKYTEALGGSAVIEKLKTRLMKGTWLTADGTALGYEVYQAAPDKLFTILNTPKQGVFERGFDGKTAWEKSSRGVRDLEGTQLIYLKRYPDLFRDIKLQGQFTRISYGGKEKIDGKDVYVLRGIGVDGKGERLYFDAQTGLLIRRITSTTTVVGLIPEQVDYEDYREVDGMKVPFTIRITSIDSFWSSTRKFTEIKLNVPVDETKFNKPPAPAVSPSP
ncbi:MAG TPA: c-type cytochrome [Pyrinomonadaceae bacterium]|nr:c-type cytochrome [Pyrinomonadaceae bacterium]